MRNKGATASTQMLTWDGTAALGFSAADVGGSAGLSDTGECVFLYTWDPAQPTDLITDLDIVVYGSLTPTNYPTDKGAITIDSAFDADRATSTYEAETSLMDQDLLRADPTRAANAIDRSIQRVDYTEGLETRSPGTGNGTGDHDETSEDLMTTFDVLTPTPSTAP